MPEYFGAPYAQEFTVDLPFKDCVNLLYQTHSRELTIPNSYKSLQSVFEITEADTQKVRFSLYAQTNRFDFSQFGMVLDAYKKIYLVGAAEQDGYGTTIRFDFYHRNYPPFYYALIPDFLYGYFRRTAHWLVVIEFMCAALGLGLITVISLLGIGFATQTPEIINGSCTWAFLVVWSTYFFGAIIPNLRYYTHPVIQLDNLIRKTFDIAHSRKKRG